MLSEKPWRGENVIQFCAALLVSFCLAAACAGLLQKLGVVGFKQLDDYGNVLISTLSFQGVTWVLIPVFLRQHEIKISEAFGLNKPNLRFALLLAVAVMMVILPVALGLQWLSTLILQKLHWEPQEETAVTLVTGARLLWMKIYLDGFALVIAPVAEEFIFRGMLFPFIKQLGFPRLAWFGVSFLFALIHLNAAAFVPLFVLALALTWLYEKTDNLLAPIIAHALFNAANLIALHFENQLNELLQKLCHVIHLT